MTIWQSGFSASGRPDSDLGDPWNLVRRIDIPHRVTAESTHNRRFLPGRRAGVA